MALAPDVDLAYDVARRETRTVRADHTIAWLGQTLPLQVGRRDPSLARTTVTVHVTPEDELYVYQGQRRVAYQVLAAAALATPAPAPAHSTLPKPVDPDVARRRRGWAYAGCTNRLPPAASSAMMTRAAIVAEQEQVS